MSDIPSDGTWAVGHTGRDLMYYAEVCDGEWQEIVVDGEMLTGRAHHMIFFSHITFPDWAKGREQEIIGRIKSRFQPPDYEYYEPGR